MDWKVRNFKETGVTFLSERIAIAITQLAKISDVSMLAIVFIAATVVETTLPPQMNADNHLIYLRSSACIDV